jgi:tetratricopeptide (TPR) repeat protein
MARFALVLLASVAVAVEILEADTSWLDGDEASVAQALRTFEAAAAKGDARARHELGEYYNRRQDYKTAADHFIAAGEGGLPDSWHAASRALARAGNIASAAQFLNAAADAGSEAAKARLARGRERRQKQKDGWQTDVKPGDEAAKLWRPSLRPTVQADPRPSVRPRVLETPTVQPKILDEL